MAKVDLELVKRVLHQNALDTRQVAQILEDIQVEVNAEIEEKEKVPAVKKQFVILISDPQGALVGKDFAGWVLQIPEGDSPLVAEERVQKAGYEFNASKRGRRRQVGTVGEACENVPATIFKTHEVWVKTKEPVLVVRSVNAFPDGGWEPGKPGDG